MLCSGLEKAGPSVWVAHLMKLLGQSWLGLWLSSYYCLLEPNHFLLAIMFNIIIRDLKSAWCQHPAKYHIGRCGSDFQSDTMWSGKSSQLWFIVGKIYFYLHYVGKNAPDDWICIFTPNPKKVILFFEPKVVSCLPGEYSKAAIANSLLYFVFCWLLQLLV